MKESKMPEYVEDKELKDSQVEWWTHWLKTRFGRLNYWRMSKEIKQRYYEECAKEIALALELERNRPDDL